MTTPTSNTIILLFAVFAAIGSGILPPLRVALAEVHHFNTTYQLHHSLPSANTNNTTKDNRGGGGHGMPPHIAAQIPHLERYRREYEQVMGQLYEKFNASLLKTAINEMEPQRPQQARHRQKASKSASQQQESGGLGMWNYTTTTELQQLGQGSNENNTFTLVESLDGVGNSSEMNYILAQRSGETGQASMYLHPTNEWLTELVDIAVGTPPQKFQLRVDDYSPSLYLIDQGASYHGYFYSKAVDDRSMFNSNASKTYRASNSTQFNSHSHYLAGSVGSDVVTFSRQLSARLPMQLASRVDLSMNSDDIEEDGILGLGTRSDGDSVVQLLADKLDEPIVTKYRYRNVHDYTAGGGQLVFGSRAPKYCQRGGWMPIINRSATFREHGGVAAAIEVSAISTRSVAGDGCTPRLEAKFQVVVLEYINTPYMSIQLGELFAQAVGAKWNSTNWCHQVGSVEQLARASPITLHLAGSSSSNSSSGAVGGGGVLEMWPQDYVTKRDNGALCLSTYPYYDQNHREGSVNYLHFGQRFLNNICVAEDIHTGERWLTRSVEQHFPWME